MKNSFVPAVLVYLQIIFYNLDVFQASGIRHSKLYPVNCVRIACRSKNIMALGSPQFFDERILLQFLHDAFHFGVR